MSRKRGSEGQTAALADRRRALLAEFYAGHLSAGQFSERLGHELAADQTPERAEAGQVRRRTRRPGWVAVLLTVGLAAGTVGATLASGSDADGGTGMLKRTAVVHSARGGHHHAAAHRRTSRSPGS